jgi:hypothetical protein
MSEQRTIRLYPLLAEHYLPMLVDFVAIVVAMVVLTVLGVPQNLLSATVILAFAALVHFVQVRRLVALRFDDTGITIIRPWRRRRVEWSRVAGLVYVSDSERHYRLRLVLDKDAPPKKAGPVVMTAHIDQLKPDLGTPRGRAAQCLDEIFAELTRRGFPPPPPVSDKFQPATPAPG